MRATELNDLIGKTGLMRLERGPLRVPVIITDAKNSYGHLRVEVKPADKRNLGRLWVSMSRVELDGERS